SVLNINIVPIVAAAGVLGFAISFGAQSLVKDMINGMFILIENQFNIGDTVELGGVKGKVEAFSLRSTVIRDIKGNVHVIPNSAITIATNVERDWSRLKVVIQIVSESDTEKAIMLTKKVLKKVSKDYKEVIIKEPKMLGITSIENGYVELTVVGKVKRFQQYEFSRKIRMYIIAEFQENHIEMPQAFLLGKQSSK
ncbi:mechanosensitive ion channel, partial [Candidatus Dojkabacteria bacterium]|nr:mechanosensitive ion channel [Candidatus Dojkabacteria bacterium]